MVEGHSDLEKDKLLRESLKLLADRKIARKWADLQRPYSTLLQECSTLMSNSIFQKDIRSYLEANPIIQETVETMLATFAMSASVKWQNIPMPLQLLARRGWYINRWVPTFLIISGPLGQFLKEQNSPLKLLLKKEHLSYPTLAQARDVFNHDLFREIRNGVGHWSFLWEEKDNSPGLVMFDWESGQPTVKVTLQEAEAFHVVALSVIEAFDKEMFSCLRSR
jgi:hypothetical protein